MGRVYFDTETNGLIDEMTHFWCLSFKNDNGQKWRFILDGYENKDKGILPVSAFKSELANIIDQNSQDGKAMFICHNLYGFDLPAINRHLGIPYGYDFWGNPSNKCTFFCSLEYSRSIYPDRPLPKGCPKSILNPITGKKKRVGTHSLEARGYALNNLKPTVHDWVNGDPALYLHRCDEDAEITRLNYLSLTEEFKRKRL